MKDYSELSDCNNPAQQDASAAQAVPDERAAFEVWIAASGRAHLLTVSPQGWYEDLTVAAWWTAWQARAALAKPSEQAQQPASAPLDAAAIRNQALEEAIQVIQDGDNKSLLEADYMWDVHDCAEAIRALKTDQQEKS